MTKGYKVFDQTMKCRNFQFKIGETYEHEGEIKLCESGFHFCTELADCFSYYGFNPKNKVCEVECEGVSEQVEDDSKRVCRKIHILKELSWYEVLDLVNIGKNNTGFGNSGDENSGDENSGNRNSGDRNSGYRNSGNRNSGHENSGDGNSGYGNSGNGNSGHGNSGDENSGNRNSGHENSGYRNSGNRNSGHENSGDGNSGNRNSGDGNSGHENSGWFNTNEPRMRIFNKYLDISIKDFNNKYSISVYPIICEQKNNELIVYDYKEAWQTAWQKATVQEKQRVLDLPHFDAKIFEEITGIKVGE